MSNFFDLIDNFLKKDPKALFDHCRNYGISGAIFISSIKFIYAIDTTSKLHGVLLFCGLIGLFVGVLLFCLNFLHGKRFMSVLILKRGVDRFPFYSFRLIFRLTRTNRRIDSRIIKKAIFLYFANGIALTFLALYEVGVLAAVAMFLISNS